MNSRRTSLFARFVSDRGARRYTVAAVLLGALLAVAFPLTEPLSAWYYFTTNAGERQRWVFSSSCNPASQITPIFDTDFPTGNLRTNIIPALLTEWNNAASGRTLYGSAQFTVNMTSSAANAFMNAPTAGQLWVVWDTDGSVLRSLGVDPTGTILGVGLPLTMDVSRPADVCAAILVLNASTSFLPTSAGNCTATSGSCTTFEFTLLHEMGHTLGFARAVGGRNGTAFSSTIANLPVMYPFAHSAFTLAPDDIAGAEAVYGQ